MAKPKSNPRRHMYDKRQERDLAAVADKLEEFEEFQRKLLPILRKDISSGMTVKELQEKYASIVQARIITTALLERDTGRALTAAKDILDRAHGKATEKKEIKHQFSELADEELDAILVSELDDIPDDDAED